jgi:hypothetical protein
VDISIEGLIGLSNELAGEIDAYNDRVADWQLLDEFCTEELAELLPGAEQSTLLELNEKADEIRSARLQQAQTRVQLVVKRRELLVKALDKSEASIRDEERHANEVMEKAAERLAASGISIEQQQAWPNNPEAAQHQLNAIAKKSEEYQAATATIQGLNCQVSSLRETVKTLQYGMVRSIADQAIVDARDDLRNTVLRMLNLG